MTPESSTTQDGDEYDKSWSYRVFSRINTEPDCPDTGQRFLTVHCVHWIRWPQDYPLHEDVFAIDHKPATPCGVTLEVALLDAERIRDAFDKPALIVAEWQKFFSFERQR